MLVGRALVTKSDRPGAAYLADLFNLSGSVAIVTGGGAGIGRSVCLALGRCGASVVAADTNLPSAEETVRLLEADGGRGIAVETDGAAPRAGSAMTEVALDTFRRVDLLVNNAGINRPAPAEELGFEDWRSVLEVNLTGVFLCSQAVGRSMIRPGGGVGGWGVVPGVHPSGGVSRPPGGGAKNAPPRRWGDRQRRVHLRRGRQP